MSIGSNFNLIHFFGGEGSNDWICSNIGIRKIHKIILPVEDRHTGTQMPQDQFRYQRLSGKVLALLRKEQIRVTESDPSAEA